LTVHARTADRRSSQIRFSWLSVGRILTLGEFPMADDRQDLTVVPIPSSETEEERRRIRSSNDRDQKAEREGRKNRHNKGYDEAADGKFPELQIERVIDE
jgi:hypothetical protein